MKSTKTLEMGMVMHTILLEPTRQQIGSQSRSSKVLRLKIAQLGLQLLVSMWLYVYCCNLTLSCLNFW